MTIHGGYLLTVRARGMLECPSSRGLGHWSWTRRRRRKRERAGGGHVKGRTKRQAGPNPARGRSAPGKPDLAASRPKRSSRRPRAEAKGGADNLGKYVYCVVSPTEPLRFGAIGIGAKPTEVQTVNYKGIAAIVSDTPLEVYDPTRENVLAHERVNETVM